MYSYGYISTLCCPNNISYLFDCLHVGHDFTNVSLFLCLFLYIFLPVYVLQC